jgi:nitrogen fixation NifU-like protein
MYSKKVMDHFMNPRNVGEIEDADGIGQVGNPVCGDMMTFYIKVKDNIIKDVKFKTFGCGAAIAVSSMVSEMAKDKTIEEALKITNRMVVGELEGLPPNKLHCSNLGADALHKAIEDYLAKQKKEPARGKHRCPYCDSSIAEDFCKLCKVKFKKCPSCGQIMAANVEHCPNCGTKNPADPTPSCTG